MRSINPLPEAVRSSVRSGVILFDLARVVEELVFNSLDAGATKVLVYVGVGTCFVKVVDDGHGITRDGLVLLGERYVTSKFLQSTDMDASRGSFGFRGEALASISDISLLEIVTKAYGRPNGYRKVIKGCKCLYLGIDDDRKDIGTTVHVRDLFYNQPVRRKYMQSSPKKVLHSVKKCVLRIGLVHSHVSFKVVDIESGDELLCTFPTTPLSLLSSEFGIEASDSLHKLNVSDGRLRLSGYTSGPYDGFEIKAFQYVYINSRFVCNGPIHKLLNQLAARFQCLGPWKVNDWSQNRKRSRSQAYPAYIMNVICPRSLYDLTFEPSKTNVEFKDWAPILTFTEKAIQQCWKDNLTLGDSIGHVADEITKDQIWKEVNDIISAEEDFSEGSEISKRKCGIKNHKASLDIFSTPSEMLTKEINHFSLSGGDGMHKNGKLKEQLEMGFVCQTDFAIQSCDGLEAKSIRSATCKHRNHTLTSDNGFFVGDSFLRNISNDSVEDNSLSSGWGGGLFKVDPDVGSESTGMALSCDLVSRSVERPFLQGCSSRQNLPLERDWFSKDEISEFQRNGFRAYRKQASANDRVNILDDGSNQSLDFLPRTWWHDEASSSPPFTGERTKCDVASDFDFPSGALVQSIPSNREHFIEDVLESDSVMHKVNFAIDWCSSTSDPLVQATSWDIEHFGDENAVGESSGHSLNAGKVDCKFDFDIMSKGSIKENCTSTCMYNKLDFDDSAGLCSDDCKFLQRPDREFTFSPEHPETLPDVNDWFYLDTYAKEYTSVDKHNSQTHAMRYLHYEHDHFPKERSRRSHSAPPFYRGKRRFFSLNHGSTMKAGKPEAQTFTNALPYSEADQLKHAKQPSDACHLYSTPLSAAHLFSDTRKEMEKITGISANQEIEDGEYFEQSHYLDIQDRIPDKVFTTKETQDAVDSWSKWRNCSSLKTIRNKSGDSYDVNTILDISMGFLNLVGDLVPASINKNCLGDAKVLQQLDKKFIPIVAGGTLAVIDQHAADERIRLEELRKKVLSGEAKTIHYLDAEQEMFLPEIAYELLQNYSEQVKDWGWICNIYDQDARSFKRNLNLLHRRSTVVTLLAVPNILGVNLSDADLLEFLYQLADTDGSSTMPSSVLRVLNMKACRGAIMFGDSLLPSECSLIVQELKQTTLCFQCAHGRPTTIPLVNLEALHQHIAKFGFLGDNPNKLWHGLHRHEFSIERAAQQLSSTRG